MDGAAANLHPVYMADSENPRHHLRAWRLSKDLTLEQVAERVELAGAERRDGESDPLSQPRRMTHASLSRIERGLQPYSQVLLEILADIYMTDPASLIIRDPSDPEGIWSIWDQLKPAQRQTALVMLTGLAKAVG